MKQKIHVIKKITDSGKVQRFYTIEQAPDTDNIQVTIDLTPMQPRYKNPYGEIIGTVDYNDDKIIFEVTTDIPTYSYNMLDVLAWVQTMVDAAMTADRGFFVTNLDYIGRPIEVYFLDRDGGFIGSINYGTPIGHIASSLFDITVDTKSTIEGGEETKPDINIKPVKPGGGKPTSSSYK